MPGNPVKHQTLLALRLRAARELGEDATRLDFACAYIAAGGTISKLAEELGAEMGRPVSRPFVSGILHGLADDATARIEAARREGAAALADQCQHIADEADPTTPASAAVANLRVRTRQWLAERMDPATYGQKPATLAVQVNVGALMLEALKQPIEKLRQMAPVDKPRLALPAASDVEVIEQSAA